MREIFHISTQEILSESKPILLLELSKHYCCYAVMYHTNNVLFLFGYFEINEDEVNYVKQLVNSFPELDIGFEYVLVKYHFVQSLLTPQEFDKNNNISDVLKLLYSSDGEQGVYIDKIEEHQINVSYLVPKELEKYIKRKYNNVHECHIYSDAIVQSLNPDYSDMIWMDYRYSEIIVVVMKAGTVHLASTFPVKSVSDMIFHLVHICEQFALHTECVRLHIQGFMDYPSHENDELHKYFENIYFITNDFINLHQDFINYPPHYFTSVCNLASCELLPAI